MILEQNIGTETVTYINHYLKGGQIMSIPQVEFDANAIRLERIFDNTEKMGYVNDGLVCEKGICFQFVIFCMAGIHL